MPSGSRRVRMLLAVVVAAAASPAAKTQPESQLPACGGEVDRTPLSIAQRLFYNGEYEQAVALTAEACGPEGGLDLCELHTSALLFEIKRALGADSGKGTRKTCSKCQPLLITFFAETTRGQLKARSHLERQPHDEATRFLLAKIDLNYVWLQLGILGRKTGWGEYWEARHALDKVLRAEPDHLRARVARAWIDYIVDTRMPLGTRWLLGGGNKRRGLLTMQHAASADGDFYARAEAAFALWDVQMREKQMREALVTARRLACDFPDNEELRRFLAEAPQH